MVRILSSQGKLYNITVDDSDNSSDDCIENFLEFKDEIPEV